MNKRIVSISTLALIGAGLALIISILPYLCPVWAEKRAGGIDDKEAATLSAALSKQSLRLAEVEQKVSRLEGQAMGATAPISTTPAFEPYVWVQLYPDSMLEKGEWKTLGSGDMIARAIVDAGQACPTITIDGRAVALVPREVIYPVSFPVTLCETPEAFSGSLAVKLGNGDSLSWSQAPKNILIIGDTGCRITHYAFQNCLYDAFGKGRWPFPKVVESALQKNFDLIIHVGDYHYRERPCPAGAQALCGTAAWGYNWTSWQADFFEPARKLLSAAPWIFVRGNHENCDRAGTGWTNFLWPMLHDKAPKSCQDFHEPYVLKLADGLSLAVLDIANSEEPNVFGEEGQGAIKNKVAEWNAKPDGEQKNRPSDRGLLYEVWMERLAESPVEGKLWFAMQQPPWQWPTKDNKQFESTAIRDETVKQIQRYLRAPDAANMAAKIELVLAGDTHVFQALRPKDGVNLPWVVISGMGGTQLDKQKNFRTESGDIFSAGGAEISLDQDIVKNLPNPPTDQSVRAFGWAGFGFTILEPAGKADFEATVYDENGQPVLACGSSRGDGCEAQ